jgi:hypothetical protein
MRVQKLHFLICLVFCAFFSGCKTNEKIQAQHESWKETNSVWRGVHLFIQSNERADELAENLPKLAAIGVNVVIAEVNYSYDFKSHPELRNRNFITRDHAKKLAAAARQNGVRLIPELDCLGHQSGRRSSLPLLARYPEFAEPPASVMDTNTAYMMSWCPLHPGVNKVVFKLIDEISEAFDADAFHVGMDEVFRIASDNCPRCRGKNPAELFAKAVNDLHEHVVGDRKMEMLMWGDRLLDGKALGYSKWEASKNGTHGAIDLIPKDIVICDWHYEKQTNYQSVPILLGKGFRVWPSGWQPLEATKAFSDFSRQQRQTNSNVVGYLCTAWSKANPTNAAEWPPIVEVMKDWKTNAR